MNITTKKRIDMREGELPLTHTFSDGIYAREIYMPKGMVVIGHKHNTTHLNILSKGKCKVNINGQNFELTAPITFESKAGSRKVLFIEEDCFWTTIHKTDETDISVLENILVDKNDIDTIQIENQIKELQCLMQ